MQYGSPKGSISVDQAAFLAQSPLEPILRARFARGDPDRGRVENCVISREKPVPETAGHKREKLPDVGQLLTCAQL